MIDTKNGAKYLDKDPPMEEHGGNITRKILDYLAYLKESLNFVFGTYGKRLTDSAGNINELHRTAEETTSRISDAEGNISVLTQRADGFDTTISDMQGNMSQISQKADRIDLLVENVGGENRIKSAAIMLAINGDTSTIKLAADKIDLEGYVTMTDLATGGRTVINGSNITTGIINADLITTGTLNADVISANSINVSKLNGSVTNGAWGVTFGSSPTFSVGYLSAERINTGYLSSEVIAAGSITAEKININDLFSRNITASNFNITGGSINIETADGSSDRIVLKNGNYSVRMSARAFKMTDNRGSNWITMNSIAGERNMTIYDNQGGVLFKTTETSITNLKGTYGNLAHIGRIDNGTAGTTSIASGATAVIATVSLGAGRWVVKGSARITNGSAVGFKINVGTASQVSGDASVGGGTDNALTTTEILDLSSTTTVSLVGYHNSGETKTVSWSLKAIRIVG